MKNYLKSFIIGSSYPVFVLFFFNVARSPPEKRNYTYEAYTKVAPIYLGLMNALSLFLAQTFNLSLRMRYILIGILSGMIVSAISTTFKTYNFDRKQWLEYYGRIILTHFFVFNVIIYTLEYLL